MKPRFLFLLTLLTAHALSAMAQQLTVTGKVVDADQEPLIGVTVQEKDGKSVFIFQDQDNKRVIVHIEAPSEDLIAAVLK